MTVVKNIFKGILIALISICILFDGLYLVIKYLLPDKLISTTFHVSDLTRKNENGETVSLGKVMELNYYANLDGSGKEMLDLKLNMFKDEKTNGIFSTGIQFIGNDEEITPYWRHYKSEDTGFLGWGGVNYLFRTEFNALTYYYNIDGNNASYVASLPITDDNYMVITINEETFRMHLRKELSSDKTKLNPFFFKEKVKQILWASEYNYKLLDWNYLAGVLLKSVRSLEPGYDGTLTFKFGDIFDYYKYDDVSKQYKKVERTKNGDLLEQVINNYYTIKVNTYYTGAKSASDSIFKMVAGDYKYNTTDSSQTNDYSLGREIIELDEFDFDYYAKYNDDNKVTSYRAIMKDNVKQFLKNKDNYLLRITFNDKNLRERNVVIKFNSDDYEYLVFDDVFTKDLLLEVKYV